MGRALEGLTRPYTPTLWRGSRSRPRKCRERPAIGSAVTLELQFRGEPLTRIAKRVVGSCFRETRLSFRRAIPFYLEESTDATIKSLLPIPKLPLIQNIPQIFSSVSYRALCSGMALPKTLEFAQTFLNGWLHSLSRCAGVVNPARGNIRLKLQESFRR